MKKIIIALAIALFSVTLSAKEISSNSSTGMTLSENLGVYTITGKAGAIILGDVKAARTFMADANKCFAQEKLKNVFEVGDQKYEVGKDDEGLYIIKIGFGGVKVRPSDTALFYTKLESIIISTKWNKIVETVKE